MDDDNYTEMLSKLNEIINELRNHSCKHRDCCVKSTLEQIDFELKNTCESDTFTHSKSPRNRRFLC